jgi:hypothetical protein
MLGAMAIASVSASRQAEGGGGADTDGADTDCPGTPGTVACSAGLSPGGIVEAFGAAGDGAGFSASIAGASAGRGIGSGTFEETNLRGLGRLSPNRPPQGNESDFRATAGPDGAQTDNTTAAMVTKTASVRPQGHLRVAFSALNFMSIP